MSDGGPMRRQVAAGSLRRFGRLLRLLRALSVGGGALYRGWRRKTLASGGWLAVDLDRGLYLGRVNGHWKNSMKIGHVTNTYYSLVLPMSVTFFDPYASSAVNEPWRAERRAGRRAGRHRPAQQVGPHHGPAQPAHGRARGLLSLGAPPPSYGCVSI